MARLTLIQTVNRVLRRLRESEVTSVDETMYSRLITDLVNQANLEAENAYYWPDLRSSATVSAVSGTDTYSLGGWGERARLDQVINETQERAIMHHRPPRWFDIQDGDLTGVPDYWQIIGYDGSGDPQIQVYPTPDGAYTLTVYAYVGLGYQTGGSAILLVPSQPVILRAYALALQERGEDAGMSFAEAQREADNALYEAIERESEQNPQNWRVA